MKISIVNCQKRLKIEGETGGRYQAKHSILLVRLIYSGFVFSKLETLMPMLIHLW